MILYAMVARRARIERNAQPFLVSWLLSDPPDTIFIRDEYVNKTWQACETRKRLKVKKTVEELTAGE